MQELKSPPCGGQAQMKAGTAAQGIGSLGARREGGGSCCMTECMRQQRASPCLALRQKNPVPLKGVRATRAQIPSPAPMHRATFKF